MFGSPAKAPAVPSVGIEVAFSWLAFSAIYLQKIGIPGLGGDFAFDHVVLWGVLLWLVIRGRASI